MTTCCKKLRFCREFELGIKFMTTTMMVYCFNGCRISGKVFSGNETNVSREVKNSFRYFGEQQRAYGKVSQYVMLFIGVDVFQQGIKEKK